MSSIEIENAIEEVDTTYGRIAFFQNDMYLGRSLREYGEWAQTELAFLQNLLETGAVVVDAGAFIGTHSMAFSSFVGPEGHVYAFEPHPTYYKVLRRNISSNDLKNVTTFNSALSKTPGKMQVAELDLGSPNSLGSVQLGEMTSGPNMVAVTVTTLDELKLSACHLIKVDVEGMESLVLSGGQSTIKNHQPYIYAECNSAEDGWAVVLMVRSLGYNVYLYSEKAYNPKNFRNNKLNIFGNARELALVCVPQHLDKKFKNQLSPNLDIVRIDRLDDLVFCLIKKPQYKQEILANSNGAALWGNDFWKNEGELERLTEQNHRITAEYDKKVADLSQTLANHTKEISNLNQAITTRDKEITSLNQAIATCNTELTNARLQLSDVISSHSWKLTAPMRWLGALARRAFTALYQLVIATYQVLPVTPQTKQKIKNIIFSLFGFLFIRTTAYQRWKEYRRLRPSFSNNVESKSNGLLFSKTKTTLSMLRSADGIWEWNDYGTVKSHIAKVKGSQLSKVAPLSPTLIDIRKEPFNEVAAKVKLPPLVDAPLVSIILPVFNNLKLTLECLLSISANTDSRILYEVILADDASTDESAEILSVIPNLCYTRSEQNLGFLRNCNRALEYVKGQFVLYLNNDVQVTTDWLVNLHRTFTLYPKAGVAGPKILYPSGHLQEAGVALHNDGTANMVGLNDDPTKPRFNYIRRVDYVSGACLMLPTSLAQHLGGFSEDFLPCYCEDSDLCLRVQDAGYHVYYNPTSIIVHHLSKTTSACALDFKSKNISANLVKFQNKWLDHLDQVSIPKILAFYLPQFHPFPENDRWWGNGFTEWTNVTKAQPNFMGHYQPRLPADLGFYDLRLAEVMQQQADLARRYGVYGFCFYYYWFGGKRLLETPIEKMLETGKPDMPFCLCWANENWTRRWDGHDQDILIAQSHSPEDDIAVINDLIRYFHDSRYIRIDGRPLILVYRATLFPNFAATVARWRKECKEQGVGEIYVAVVESMELTHANKHPSEFGCDAAVEFPPQGMAEQTPPSGAIINPDFAGATADYRSLAVKYATREFPGYTRFKGVMPGWDNTARKQNNSFCFEYASPGAFQAWLEETIEQTRQQHYGDERLVFVNAWNEWAEGAYLEPDRRFGHTYLEAVKNATEATKLLRRNQGNRSN